MLKSETTEALIGLPDVIYHKLISETGYASYVEMLWLLGKGFILNEQDIVSGPGNIDELKTCERDWCAYPYKMGGGNVLTGLGLTKFSDRLVYDFPRTLTIVNQFASYGTLLGDIPRKHWLVLDMRLQRVLRSYGLVPHVHSPPVTHLHDY